MSGKARAKRHEIMDFSKELGQIWSLLPERINLYKEFGRFSQTTEKMRVFEGNWQNDLK